MITTIKWGKEKFEIDLDRPLDISIPLTAGGENGVNAWGIPRAIISPHTEGDYTGAVSEGASVNFNNIHFNPHSHLTHTECVGHITKEIQSVNKLLKSFFFVAKVVTIAPEKYQDDFVISRKQLQYALEDEEFEALVIRTLPNTPNKKTKDYTDSNPPYLLEETALLLAERQIDHLLIDLPSVDKEDDFGALLAHRAFWDLEGTVRSGATITEMIYVDNSIEDGMYILNLQTAPIENDAVPSRPVLFKIISD